jgi:hypothetical protein
LSGTIFAVELMDESMILRLNDGRTLSIPLAWYPRLLHGSQRERMNFELIGEGEGIHWPELDEDVSIVGLLAGRRSTETNASLTRWLERRKYFS